MEDPPDFEFLFNMLCTIPALINIVFPFYGGFILDKFGARNCLLVYILLVTMGHVLYTVGLSAKSWLLLFLGRAVFGLGDGSTSVANLIILTVWFEGKELALALGLNLSASRVGSVVNNLISPAIARYSTILGVSGVVMSSVVAVIVVVIAFLAAIFIYIIDKQIENDIKNNHVTELYGSDMTTY